MRACFIVGAGASFSSASIHFQGSVWPRNPPLGTGLFTQLEKFSEEWRNLPQEIKNEFGKNGRNFESGMARIQNLNSELIAPLTFEMGKFFIGFHLMGTSSYMTLVKKLYDSDVCSEFVSLNYDVILEDSINRLVGKDIIPDKQKLYQSVSVIKPHGSANFLPKKPNQVYGIGIKIMMPDNDYRKCKLNGMVDAEYERVYSRERIHEFYRDINRLPPAMSAYSPEKRTYYGKKIIEEELSRTKIAIESADVAVIIGTSFNIDDRHLWDHIGNSRAKVLICDPNPELTYESIQRTYGKSSEVISLGFSDCAEKISDKLRSMAG